MSQLKKPYVKPALEKREKLSLITSGVPTTAATKPGSDARLKTDIHRIGTFSGYDIYTYRYIGDSRSFAGVMAQDLLRHPIHRDAVSTGEDGYYRIDPAKLGLQFERLDEMVEAGENATEIAISRLH